MLSSFHFLLEGKGEPNQKPKTNQTKTQTTHIYKMENRKIENKQDKHTDQKGRYTYYIR